MSKALACVRIGAVLHPAVVSHSLIALASFSTPIAQLRSVLIAGRLSFVISIEFAPALAPASAPAVRCAVRDWRRASALDPSGWTLSRNRLSDSLCSQPRPSGRGIDLVRVPTSQNRFATEAHARAVLEFETRKAFDPIRKTHATMYIRDRSTRNSHQAPVHGQATRSVSAHDHLFASVRLMMNAIVLSSRSGSDRRSKWPRKQRREKPPARNIRHLISNY